MQMRVLRSGSYSQPLTAVRPVGARAVGCRRRVQREAAMPRPKGGGGGAAAAAEEDAPSTQQVRASVARTEALADRLDELRGRIAGEAEYDSERDLSLDESFELSVVHSCRVWRAKLIPFSNRRISFPES